MRCLLLGCALLLGSLTTIPCSAQEPQPPTGAKPEVSQLSAEDRERAVRLADEGARLFDTGDFAGAREKFEQAEAIVSIPPFTVQRARALENLGRWAEALLLYERVATTPLPKDAAVQHALAVRDAERAARALSPKVPRVTVKTIGAVPAEVYVDGRGVGPAGPTPRFVDPGDHVVEARGREGSTAQRAIQIKASESMTIELPLAAPPEVKRPPKEPSTSVWTILGYVGMGVGGASLLVATATGIPAIAMGSDLDSTCPNGQCPPSQFDTVDTYDALRWTSGVTLIAGLVIAGAGITSFVLAPERGILGGEVKADIGASSASLTVTFP